MSLGPWRGRHEGHAGHGAERHARPEARGAASAARRDPGRRGGRGGRRPATAPCIGSTLVRTCSPMPRAARCGRPERGGRLFHDRRRPRAYAIQVAEKGVIWTRMRATGTPSHGSMPSPDNAAIKLADAAGRLAARHSRHDRRRGAWFFEGRPGEMLRLAEAGDDEAVTAAIEAAVSEPTMQRSSTACCAIR